MDYLLAGCDRTLRAFGASLRPTPLAIGATASPMLRFGAEKLISIPFETGDKLDFHNLDIFPDYSFSDTAKWKLISDLGFAGLIQLLEIFWTLSFCFVKIIK